MKIQVKLIDNKCKPLKNNITDSCYDLVARIDKPVSISFGEIVKVPTGIITVLPPGWEALVYARSGISSKHGIAPVNCVGVIDQQYRGEIIVPLTKSSIGEDYIITPYERIAQIAFRKIPEHDLEFLPFDAVINPTERGDNGFGSSGKV